MLHLRAAMVLEGEWTGTLIVIAFADLDAALAWYRSPAYQEIVPLRARNADGATLIIDGVEDGHRAIDVLAKAGG